MTRMKWYELIPSGTIPTNNHLTTIGNAMNHLVYTWDQVVATTSEYETNIAMKPTHCDCKLNEMHIFGHEWQL